MSDFVDIFGEVLRIVTFQPREARMRYRLPEWDQGIQALERSTRDSAIPADPRSTNGKPPASAMRDDGNEAHAEPPSYKAGLIVSRPSRKRRPFSR